MAKVKKTKVDDNEEKKLTTNKVVKKKKVKVEEKIENVSEQVVTEIDNNDMLGNNIMVIDDGQSQFDIINNINTKVEPLINDSKILEYQFHDIDNCGNPTVSILDEELLKKEEKVQMPQGLVPKEPIKPTTPLEVKDPISNETVVREYLEPANNEKKKHNSEIENKLIRTKNKTNLKVFDGNLPDSKKKFQARHFGYTWNGMEIDY